jgi:hypothetical protein
MPVPSQGHYGFPSFPVVDWFCLFMYLWVLTAPNLPLLLRFKCSGGHYNSIYNMSTITYLLTRIYWRQKEALSYYILLELFYIRNKSWKPEVVDWFCLFMYLWVLTFPLENCSEFGNFVITLMLSRVHLLVTRKASTVPYYLYITEWKYYHSSYQDRASELLWQYM